MNFQAVKYSTKIWITSSVLSPIPIAFFTVFPSHYESVVSGFLKFYFYAVVLGLLFSTASWIALTLIIIQISRIKIGENFKRFISQIISITLCLITFYSIMNQAEMKEGYSLFFDIIIYYIVVLSFGIWFFDFPTKRIHSRST